VTLWRDHGGDLDMIRAARGGDDWIDLSTGINRVPYPVPPLPRGMERPALRQRARCPAARAQAYRTQAPMVALAGAQAAIQMLPLVLAGRKVRVLSPDLQRTCRLLRRRRLRVEEVTTPDDLAGAEIAVVVNPNNPDGGSSRPPICSP
jgi:cobalamin biosynthetic protein CobC